MYSGFTFFSILLALGLVFPIIVDKFKSWITYPQIVFIFSLFTYILIFAEAIYIPIILSLLFFVIEGLKSRGYIKNIIAIPLTLIPLVLVKLELSVTLMGTVGLSFMTFRAIDVLLYSQDTDNRSGFRYFTYLFLPLVILAGPMYRWRTFTADLDKQKLPFSIENYLAGVELLLLGIAQKFLLGWLVYTYVIVPYSTQELSMGIIVIMSVGYSLYLYFDFAGYSNMARGAGMFFGLDIPKNFNNPILSKNPQDFWQRFHISLSEWLRDVIFTPVYKKLVGYQFFKRHRIMAQNIAIFLTLFCMGIWNGIELHYILSGVLFGIYSVSHNTLIFLSRKYSNIKSFLDLKVISIAGRVLTLAVISFSLYVFSGYSPL